MNTPVVDKLIIPFQVNISSDGKDKGAERRGKMTARMG
jgi:hypothetical protein